jgi:hypothetical protein
VRFRKFKFCEHHEQTQNTGVTIEQKRKREAHHEIRSRELMEVSMTIDNC